MFFIIGIIEIMGLVNGLIVKMNELSGSSNYGVITGCIMWVLSKRVKV